MNRQTKANMPRCIFANVPRKAILYEEKTWLENLKLVLLKAKDY